MNRDAVTNSTSSQFVSNGVSSSLTIPITIINLDRDTTRWASVLKELTSKTRLPPEHFFRLDAVCGHRLSADDLRNNTSTIARLFCTPGMIGCFLSHRKFWLQTYTDDSPWQMVLEDDVIVADNFVLKAQSVIEELQRNPDTCDKWDVLLVGAFGCVDPCGKFGLNRANAFFGGGGRQMQKISDHVHVPHRPFGTHAYVLSKQGAHKLLQKSWTVTGHVDAVAWGIKDLALYCADPMLANQAMEMASTIGAVTKGPETWLSATNWKVDQFTGVTLKWALNSPLMRVPGMSVTLSFGRSIALTLIGFVFGVAFMDEFTWVLPMHSAMIVSLVIVNRIMCCPKGPPKGIRFDELGEESINLLT